MREKGGWVYIMANRPKGTIYIGVTSDLERRVTEHREGLVPGFTKRYGLKRLVYAEPHDDITTAIQREKTMKHWSRAWKVAASKPRTQIGTTYSKTFRSRSPRPSCPGSTRAS